MSHVAGATDVADLLGVTFTPAEVARCERLIVLVEGLFVSHVPGLKFTQTSQTVTVDGSLDSIVILPVRPITAISAVRIDGTTIAASSYRWTSRGELIRVTGDFAQTLTAPAGAWGGVTTTIEVDVTAGPCRTDLRLIAAELVRDLWINPARANAETLGQRSITWGRTDSSLRLSDAQEDILEAYRPRVMSTRIGLG